ncbi:MAG: decaprenyl-phosphate phosphoribosyltransferase [Cyanobacteria bacterium PR.3.49]|nr:decaprenyl-phosphate phosphoribosyltransferase [Cyanobacteria bacterium PR.3.49]
MVGGDFSVTEANTQAENQSSIAAESTNPAEKIRLILKLIRPKQWAKNLIVFAPALFSGKIFEPATFSAAAMCFVAFSLCASSVYVVNDVLDCKSDRLHPKKKNRPIASGKISPSLAMFIGVLCAAGALAVGFLVRPTVDVFLLVYFVLMMFYALVLKHYVLLDVFAIAAGFVLRAAAGAAAVGVESSGWFLACTSFGALFLGLEKRRQETMLLKGDAASHRKTLNAYSPELVDRMEAVIVPSLVTCYAFYTFQSYHGQWMMLTLPFVLYGVMRYQVLSVKSEDTGAPDEVLWKDRGIQVTLLLWVLTSAGVVYGVIPKFFATTSAFLDGLR